MFLISVKFSIDLIYHMLNFTMKKNFSEKWPLSLNRWPQNNINYIFELLVENTLKCNQIKNVHIGENGQGPLFKQNFLALNSSI
jgi:hypothetical protein